MDANSKTTKRIGDKTMTREEIKELLPIIQAFAEGKQIEVKRKNEWFGIGDDIYFSESPSDYRIKPEPKYRPFKTQEECWNEMHKHSDFGWVIAKDSKIMHLIYVVGIGCVLMDDMSISFPETFAEYEFTDGTPFGIKEE